MEIYGNSRNSLSQKSRKSLILLIINDGNIYKACGVPAGMSHFWAFIWHSVSAVPLIKVTIQSLPLGADSPVTWYQVTPPTHSANCSAIHHFYNLRVMHNKSQVNNKWARLWGVRSVECGVRNKSNFQRALPLTPFSLPADNSTQTHRSSRQLINFPRVIY